MARRCAALGIPLCALVLSVRLPPSTTGSRGSPTSSAANGVRLALEFVPYTAVRTLAEAQAVCGRSATSGAASWSTPGTSPAQRQSPAGIADLARRGSPACNWRMPQPRRPRTSPTRAAGRGCSRGRARRLRGRRRRLEPGYSGPLGTEVLASRLTAQPPSGSGGVLPRRPHLLPRLTPSCLFRGNGTTSVVPFPRKRHHPRGAISPETAGGVSAGPSSGRLRPGVPRRASTRPRRTRSGRRRGPGGRPSSAPRTARSRRDGRRW